MVAERPRITFMSAVHEESISLLYCMTYRDVHTRMYCLMKFVKKKFYMQRGIFIHG